MDHRETGVHVKNIKYLGEWLSVLSDYDSSMVLTLFPGIEGTKVECFQEEGDKFLVRLKEIIETEKLWYLGINKFYSSSDIGRKLAKNFKCSVITETLSVLRLLPTKKSEDSIESIIIPQVDSKIHQVEPFELLAVLYDSYLDLELKK